MKRSVVVFFIFAFICFVLIIFITVTQKNAVDKVVKTKSLYYDRYSNLHLLGKIINKTPIDNDRYSIYGIEIYSSNIKLHDLRDSASNFFLVIINKKAKMVYPLSYNIFINDSIEISYEKREMLIFRNNSFYLRCPLPEFSDYYLSMQKKGFELMP